MSRLRLIEDGQKDVYYVRRNTPGKQGKVNANAARLLKAAGQAEDKLNSKDVAFLQTAQRMGWLDADGQFAGSVTTIPRAPHLTRLQIELTLACNLRCSYCYSGSGPARKECLDLKQVFELLNDAKDLGVFQVDFTGGEFFLYKDWRAVVDYAFSLGLAYSIHTNGTPLTEEHVTYLSERGVTHIQVSIDSNVEDVHDDVRGRKGALKKTVAGVHIARGMNIPVNVSVVLHKKNVEHVGELVRWVSKELKSVLLLDRIISAGKELEAGLGLTAREFYESIAPYLSRDVMNSKVCGLQEGSSVSNVEPECGVAHSYVYVTAQGELAICPTMTSRDDPRFKSPTLSQMSLREAWVDSDYFNSFRFLNCKNISVCPAAKTCGGGCRSNAYLDGGELDSPDIVACNINKNNSKEYVDFYQIYDGATSKPASQTQCEVTS